MVTEFSFTTTTTKKGRLKAAFLGCKYKNQTTKNITCMQMMHFEIFQWRYFTVNIPIWQMCDWHGFRNRKWHY